MPILMCMYSETSDKGHSERGQTSQQRTHHLYSSIHTLYKITSERGQPLYKGQMGGPNGVRSTVHVYLQSCVSILGSVLHLLVNWSSYAVNEPQLMCRNKGLISVHHHVGSVPQCSFQVTLCEELCIDEVGYPLCPLPFLRGGGKVTRGHQQRTHLHTMVRIGLLIASYSHTY